MACVVIDILINNLNTITPELLVNVMYGQLKFLW